METGRLAKQAAGSVLLQFGETVVLAAVTVSHKRSTLPFFPLTVEYREKTYAAGKIPGGFIKREGRPSEKEVLTCRVIDRSLRPLFPDGFKNEVQVFITVLSADQENDADVLALNAAVTALSISEVPWGGPLAGVRVGRVNDMWVLNPTFEQLEYSTVDLIVSGSRDSIVMVEGGAVEATEEEILEGLSVAHGGIREMLDITEPLRAEAGRPDMEWTAPVTDETLAKKVHKLADNKMAQAINASDKAGRAAGVTAVKTEVQESLAEEYPEGGRDIGGVLHDIEADAMRRQVLEKGERIDGRDMDTVRPITPEVSVLPRAHGSAVFTRGQTQALVTVTLGTADDEQRIDSIDMAAQTTKSFMLHYNFPPFCTGEVRMIRGTSRREIGHGMLAERALQPLLPDYEDFPYTIRIVSEILESNGSSSMATVCGGSLALMDAGVPMKAAVAGVAMGLIAEGDNTAILTDILGTEDHLGDMDFKVAGTAKGITALQMDIKVGGVTSAILSEALQQAKKARLEILDIMNQTLSKPREAISPYAPHIFTLTIPRDKIGGLIGPGGKVIRGIVEATGAKIDVMDDGKVNVFAVDEEAAKQAMQMVQDVTATAEVGKTYLGKVVRLVDFGAFVEIFPGTDGLLHISEIAEQRIRDVRDELKEGDQVMVKVLTVEGNKIRLSRKAVLREQRAKERSGAS